MSPIKKIKQDKEIRIGDQENIMTEMMLWELLF